MKYEYPEAGKDAPAEVQDAIARFRALPEHEKENTPLLWWLLNDSTQVFKMDQKDAQYTDQSPGKACCRNCDFAYLSLRWNVYVCSQVSSLIEPAGWCKLWERSPERDYPYERR